MKQVININFQGRVVPIEVTAFDILKAYTESLNRYFANEEGKEEIINDIESRIGELFQERIKEGSTCITDDDINAIIRSMGRPEDFETDQATADAADERQKQQTTGQSAPFSTIQPGTNKRLYRDENSKVLGGVCSGLANYFGIDVVVVRIIFVVLFGALFLPYLILWIAIPSTASTEIGGVRKKLYRDNDDKIIAGVCSGIGNYFGVNAWIPRVLFLLPFLSFVSRWSHWGDIDFPNFIRLGFSPGALIIYIILWLVIPEANTTAEKLEMKGEKVDMNSIKNSVMEEMKGVQQRAEKFGKEAKTFAQERGKTMGTEVSEVAKRSGRSLGDIIVLLFKIFAYLILGSIGFALVIALFALGIASVGLFAPIKDFVLNDVWQNIFAWGTLIFFIATPIVGILTWVIRRLAKIRNNSKTMRFGFIGLWIIGWVCVVSLVASISNDFRYSNRLNEEDVALTNPGVAKLEVTTNSPNKKYYRNNWFRIEPFENIEEDTAIVRNIRVHIIKSPNDSFRVTMIRTACSFDKNDANRLANLIDYQVMQMDSLLIIDKGIMINRTDKFRNQGVTITIYVPVGKHIKINNNVGWGNDVHFGGWRDDRYIESDDVEEGWDQGVDYIMTANEGLTSEDGTPANSWKYPRKKTQQDQEEDDDSNGVRMKGSDNYRYDRNTAPAKLDSAKQKLDVEQKRIIDSLQKVKDKIDKQLEKLDAGTSQPNAVVTYSMPAYNPMMILY